MLDLPLHVKLQEENSAVLRFNNLYIVILNLLFLGVSQNAYAQRFYAGKVETGFVIGGSGYYGDLSHNSQFKRVGPNLGFMMKRAYQGGFFSTRLQLNYQRIQGTDADNKNYVNRNLTFQSPVYSIFSTIECNFHAWGTNPREVALRKGTAYAFLGLGLFGFNPSRLENNKINLQDLNTNGSTKYSLLQPAIPLGLGYKRIMNKRSGQLGAWVIGVEMCWFKTFTDKLDDVGGKYRDYNATLNSEGLEAANYQHPQVLKGFSPYPQNTVRGDTHLNDWYYYFGVTLSFKLRGGVCPSF